MKNFILILMSMIIFMCIPSMVIAKDTCSLENIKIESIELKDKTDIVIENSPVSIDNKKIYLDLKMYEVGDYVEYELKVKNNSNDNFYFDEKSLNINSDYFDYNLKYKDNSNEIKPGEEKTINLRVEYKKEIEKEKYFNGSYINSKSVSLNISDNKKSIITNPLTKNNKLLLIIISIIIISTLYFINKKKYNNILLFILGVFLILPFTTYALCKINIEIEPNIEVVKAKPNPCTYDGEMVEGTKYVNGQYTYTYHPSYKVRYYDSEKSQYLYVDGVDEDGWSVVLTDKNSTNPVTSKLCSSINEKPIVSMSSMFQSSKTTSIDLSSFDTSNVVDMYAMFQGDYNDKANYHSLDLSNFNTSKLVSMGFMFSNVNIKHDLDFRKLDLSNVISMENTFYNSNFKSINLSGANLCNVKELQNGFSHSVGNDVDLSNTIIYNATSLDYLFSYSKFDTVDFNNAKTNRLRSLFNSFLLFDGKLINLNGLNMSNVETIEMLFQKANVKRIDLRNIDTGKIVKWYLAFFSCEADEVLFPDEFTTGDNATLEEAFLYSKIPRIDLHGFDTSKVINMENLFDGTTASEIILSEKFTIDNIKKMSSVFKDTKGKTLDLTSFDITKIPEKTLILWNSEYEKIYVKSEEDAEWYRNNAGRSLKKGEFVVKN